MEQTQRCVVGHWIDEAIYIAFAGGRFSGAKQNALTGPLRI